MGRNYSIVSYQGMGLMYMEVYKNEESHSMEQEEAIKGQSWLKVLLLLRRVINWRGRDVG